MKPSLSLSFPFGGFDLPRAAVIALMTVMMTWLAGCQSTPAPSGSSYLNQFQLSEITVDYSQAEEPLRVADLEAQIRRNVGGDTPLENLGTQMGLANRGEVRRQLEAGITANIVPHMRDALTPIFTGTRPLRAVVMINSVFIRSRASLQQLTGAKVTVNGERRPDNPQVIATIVLYDQETGYPFTQVGPIRKIDDGTIVIAGGGPKAPDYGPAKRLNKLAFEVAQASAEAIREDATSGDTTVNLDQF
ncbi:MAG: hypothetical protein KDJ69_17110 [Nitratireductor sp.]|nr:hypothetical protein [Nitratireductor sp.]